MTFPQDVERVIAVVSRLEQALGSGGRVLDPILRRRIVDAHAASGWDDGAEVVVQLGPPASADDLTALEQLWRRRFGASLPADYRALLERHDGIAVYEAEAGAMDAAPQPVVGSDDRFGGYMLMPARTVRDWLESTVYEKVEADGVKRIEHPRFSPFFDLDGGSWYGFDFLDGSTSRPPITHPDSETLWASNRPPVAWSFVEWLEAWAAAAFEPICLFMQVSGESSTPAPGPEKKPPPVELPVALALTRPKLGPRLGALCTGALLLLLVAARGRFDLELVLGLVVFAYFVQRSKLGKHTVVIDEQGVRDEALGRALIPWTEIVDVSADDDGGGASLMLRLAGAPPRDVRVTLDGVQTPVAMVRSTAIEFWLAKRNLNRQ